MGSNFFEGKGDYIVYGSHTGQSNNTLTQYSSEQGADIILKLDTNNNLCSSIFRNLCVFLSSCSNFFIRTFFMKHRKMKGSDKETTITAEEYAQILKNAAETAQVAEQTGSKYSIDKAAYYAQLSKDAAAKVHESSEMEAKIETSSPCFEGPAQKFFINKTDLKAPLLGGDDIAYGDAIQPDFQHKEALPSH
jgi:hypothetical protein